MRAAPYDAVDLFAGPGGWDEGARALGVTTVGVEYDLMACRTGAAAGHARVCADVRALPLHPFLGIPGLIASPPCPTFSAAGSGTGRHDLPLLLEAITLLGAGVWPAEQIDACQDDRTPLTLEPLRWALYLRPEWIVLEQVPAVLPVWEAMAVVLREQGYSAWTGCLQAEEYGVPQTRRRAVLIASRMREVTRPVPTHTRYRKGKPRQEAGLLPWVSMADALGWDEGGLVGFPRRPEVSRADGRAVETSTVVLNGEEYRARDMRDTDQPAQVVTEKVRSWTLHTGQHARPNDRSVPRAGDEPAHTLTAGHDSASLQWRNGTGANAAVRPADEPAPTVHFGERLNTVTWEERTPGLADQVVQADVADRKPWCDDRPATTLATRDLVPDPGANANRFNGATKSRNDGVRVEPQEAAVLQSFPVDYPWQGTRTKVFQQIGNAVPPLLALAVLEAAL